MIINAIHQLGHRYLTSFILLFFILSSGCLSQEAKEKKEIKKALMKKYTTKADQLAQKIREQKAKVPELQKKIKVAIDPREQGKYVTKMQKIEARLKKYKEQSDDLKRKIIELNN